MQQIFGPENIWQLVGFRCVPESVLISKHLKSDNLALRNVYHQMVVNAD